MRTSLPCRWAIWTTSSIAFAWALIAFTAQVNAAGLVNGDFEQGNFASWTDVDRMEISANPVHGGRFAARSTGGGARQEIPVIKGKNHKLIAWVYVSEVVCQWGGVRLAAFNPSSPNWTSAAEVTDLQNSLPNNKWTKVALSFTPQLDKVIIEAGIFGDCSSTEVTFDDIEVTDAQTGNTPPTVDISSSTSVVDSIPGEVDFSSIVSDSDGAPSYLFWDFGDGGHSNIPNPSHSYLANGTYTVKLIVYDDGGASASKETTVTVNDARYPTINLSNPAQTSSVVTDPKVSLKGTVTGGGQIRSVTWSTDRGLIGHAQGTARFNAIIDLSEYGGRNRILINAIDSTGKSASKEIIINYQAGKTVSIVGEAGGVTQNSASIEQFEKFEATFGLQNSVASDPSFPYEIDLPSGMPQGTGITVEATFVAPSGAAFVQPGFLYQQYQRRESSSQLLAQGDAVWKIRFAPNQIGRWTYQIRIQDASGATSVSGPNLAFDVTRPTDPENHGHLRVSKADSRYFEFDDGTPFIGVGPSAQIRDPLDVDQQLSAIPPNSTNFSRTWMSGANIGGSSWAPWTGGVGYEGNYPGTALTTNEAYGDGDFSLTLPQSDSEKRCAFYGFQGSRHAVKPNTWYRVMVRLKADAITGDGGFTFRPSVSWPGSCDSFAGDPTIIPYVKGTHGWHVVTGRWNSGSETELGFSLLTLENVTGGRVYIDEISIREELSDEKFGPEVLSRSKFNPHRYFSQEPSWSWDYGLDQLAKRGIYQKIVIEEKGDYAFNHISPYGFGYSLGEKMGAIGGASMKYQLYYWRYLQARWGYSRAVHSWEYANEQAPGSLAEANELSRFMHQSAPGSHLATTSFWCCINDSNGYFWNNPSYSLVDYADSHAYVTAGHDDTSWLGTKDPFTGRDFKDDLALYVSAHSLDVWNKQASGGKPIVMGEAGIGNGNIIAGNNDNDQRGIWFHHYLWAQMNPGGMYFIYWYDDTIKNNNLYGLAVPYRKFMEGSGSSYIPLNNGNYQNIELNLPSELLGWGQKDLAHTAAHFWIYDKEFNWSSPNGGSPLRGKTVSFDGLPAETYTVEWWNTWTGETKTSIVNHQGGVMNLTIPADYSEKDIAIKIYAQGRSVCGNGIREGSEQCDRNCVGTCDDNNSCTRNEMIGEATSCNIQCSFPRIEECVSGDHCCPAGCTIANDSDCSMATHSSGVIDDGATPDNGKDGGLGCTAGASSNPFGLAIPGALMLAWSLYVARKRK